MNGVRLCGEGRKLRHESRPVFAYLMILLQECAMLHDSIWHLWLIYI